MGQRAPVLSVRKRKAPTLNQISKLELLTKSVVEQFSKDPTFPSIKFSYLTNIDKYYVSIVRYKAIYGREGYALMKAHGETLQDAIEEVFALWLNYISAPTNATETLIAFKKGL